MNFFEYVEKVGANHNGHKYKPHRYQIDFIKNITKEIPCISCGHLMEPRIKIFKIFYVCTNIKCEGLTFDNIGVNHEQD